MENVLQLPISSTVLVSIKIGMLIFLMVYIVFSIIVVKQVNLMIDTVKIGFETPLKLISFMHFLFAISVFLIVLLI